MKNPARQIFGISIFWLALSLLFDGLNTLVLPYHLAQELPAQRQASTLGLLTFGGLALGMLIQPAAGHLSDRLAPRMGRKGMLAVGLAGCLLALAMLAQAVLAQAVLTRAVLTQASGLAALAIGYALVQAAASWAQAAQQGFLPDLIPARLRGTASGFKGVMDLSGAMLGFVLLGQLLGDGQPGLALGLMAAVLLVTFGLTLVFVREARGTPGEDAQIVTQSEPGQPGRRFFWAVISRFFFLLGTYAVGRFLLLFVAQQLRLDPGAAAQQAGGLLAGLALVTVLASVPAGWAADRFGRVPLMLSGAGLSLVGALLFSTARVPVQLFLFGTLLSLGSAAFAGASWALTADLTPPGQAGRYFGLANLGTAGAAAAAGLFGLLVDAVNVAAPGQGFNALFAASGLAFVLSAAALLGLRSGGEKRLSLRLSQTRLVRDPLPPLKGSRPGRRMDEE